MSPPTAVLIAVRRRGETVTVTVPIARPPLWRIALEQIAEALRRLRGRSRRETTIRAPVEG